MKRYMSLTVAVALAALTSAGAIADGPSKITAEPKLPSADGRVTSIEKTQAPLCMNDCSDAVRAAAHEEFWR